MYNFQWTERKRERERIRKEGVEIMKRWKERKRKREKRDGEIEKERLRKDEKIG